MRTASTMSNNSPVPLGNNSTNGYCEKFQLVPDTTAKVHATIESTESSSTNKNHTDHNSKPISYDSTHNGNTYNTNDNNDAFSNWDSELDKMMHEDLAKPRGSLADLSLEILMLTKSSLALEFGDSDDDDDDNGCEKQEKDQSTTTSTQETTFSNTNVLNMDVIVPRKASLGSTSASTRTGKTADYSNFEESCPPSPSFSFTNKISPSEGTKEGKTYATPMTSNSASSGRKFMNFQSNFLKHPQRRRNSTGGSFMSANATATTYPSLSSTTTTNHPTPGGMGFGSLHTRVIRTSKSIFEENSDS